MKRPRALVTGASKGIGLALARGLATRGYDLLLSARSLAELESAAEAIRKEYSVQADVFPADLSIPSQVQSLVDYARDRFASELKILVNNAGYGMWGWFQTLPLEEQLRMLHVNVQAPLILSHAFLPILHQNGPSYILNISSSTAYQALPTMSVYAASKAFMVQMSRGLRLECQRQRLRVSVTCVSPGATKTNFIDRAGMEPLRKMSDAVGMTPEAVARVAIKAMLAGKTEVVPGLVNKMGAALARYLPKKVAETAAGNIYVKKLADSNRSN